MNNFFKMFVITHKKFNYKLNKDYEVIQVGKANTKNQLPYISDDTGNNIAIKNNSYCELTAIYWLWKNYDLPQYIGICHYRRYFVYGILSRLVDENYIKKNISKYDVILPCQYKTESNVYNHFINSTSGREKDLINLRKIIEEKYPDYINMYDTVMNSQKTSYCNMAIMKKDDYNNYCKWLFNILFELETITDMTGYTKQEKRLYGFLSEFLLNVWIQKNNLKIKYCNMYYIENNKIKNFLKKIKLGIRSICL